MPAVWSWRPIGLLDLKEDNLVDAKLLCVPDVIPDSAASTASQIAPSQLEEVAEFSGLTKFRGVIVTGGEMRVLSRFSISALGGQLDSQPTCSVV